MVIKRCEFVSNRIIQFNKVKKSSYMRMGGAYLVPLVKLISKKPYSVTLPGRKFLIKT